MAQTRHFHELHKRDIKQQILFFIRSHAVIQTSNGPEKAKENDFQASHEEISKYLARLMKFNGREIIPRRTIYNYLEELKKEELIRQVKYGPYELTEQGMLRWSFINAINKAQVTLPSVESIATFFDFGPKENGITKYVDIFIRVGDPKLIQNIEKSIFKNKVNENEQELFGRALAGLITLHFSGQFSVLQDLVQGKEKSLLEILDKLPIDI
jgi:hypothetical protein